MPLTTNGVQSVVDIGCGTGLLAITAARLGAARVVGTDLDETVAVARANGERNGVNAGGPHVGACGGVEWATLGTFDWSPRARPAGHRD